MIAPEMPDTPIVRTEPVQRQTPPVCADSIC